MKGTDSRYLDALAEFLIVKKFLGFMVFLVFVLATALVVWLNNPKIEDPRLVAESRKALEQRFHNLQARARNAKVNIYLDPEFDSLWSKTATPNPSLHSAITDWNNKCREYREKGWAGAKEDPSLSIAFEHFKESTSGLAQCLRKPFFIVPNSSPDSATDKIDENELEGMETALANELEYSAIRGEWAQVAELTENLLHFGRACNANAAIGGGAVGRSQSIVLDSLGRVVTPKSDLTSSEWADLSVSVLHELPSNKRFYLAMEASLYQVDYYVEKYKARISQGLIHQLPGIWDRERRIRVNFFARILKAIERDGNIQALATAASQASPGFASRIPLPSSGVFYDHARELEFQLEFTRRGLLGMGLSFGLFAYRTKHEEFPEELSQLQDVGVDLKQYPEWLEPEAAYQKTGANSATLTMPLTSSGLIGPLLEGEWVFSQGNSMVFELGDKET